MPEKIYEHPNIWKLNIPLPQNPLKALNSYVVVSRGEMMVIDTGFHRPECAQAMKEELSALGRKPGDCRLFLTHLHSDHVGLAELFTEEGVVPYLSKIDADYLKNNLEGSNWKLMEEIFLREGFPSEEISRQATENQARIYAPSKMFPVTHVFDGDTLSLGDLTFTLIHTPGHTPGHICLYLKEQKILFSADHVLFDITPNITVWHGVEDALQDYLNSIEKIRSLDVKTVFPAHRSAGISLGERLDTLAAHHRERLEEIEAAVKKQPQASVYQIASTIQWSAKGRRWEDFPPNQKWFAMGETLSHIIHLRRLGRLPS